MESGMPKCSRRALALIFLQIFICLSLPNGVWAGYNEKKLLHKLLDHYNVLERPVANESDPLQLSFGLTLMQIIDVDEKNQLLITNIWLKLFLSGFPSFHFESIVELIEL